MAGIEKQVKKAVKGKGTGGKKKSSKGGSAKGVERPATQLLKQTGTRCYAGRGVTVPAFSCAAVLSRCATEDVSEAS